MGVFNSKISAKSHIISVKTGDQKSAGTDADIKVILFDEQGQKSPEINLDVRFHRDFERGQTDHFPAKFDLLTFGDITQIELWRNDKGIKDDWFCEVITITEKKNNKKVFYFPVQRWVKPHQHYSIKAFDTCLPQIDSFEDQRKQELDLKKQHYVYTQKGVGLPAQIKDLPDDEQFSDDYKWDLKKMKTALQVKSLFKGGLSHDSWENMEKLKSVYSKDEPFVKPSGVDLWQNDDYFGAQRLKGCNPTSIELCTEIPEKFGVTAEMLNPLLGNITLEKALESKRLFMVDHKILDGLGTAATLPVLCCAPIALFFLTDEQRLRPVAIQLYQRAAPDNPVFLPSDPKDTWQLAKMWFNLADSSIHQSLVHLGLTHLLMEGVCICTHRNLALNHPIFRLLAHHFLYILAVNTRAVAFLINPGGFVDGASNVGSNGLFEIIRRGCEIWKMDTHGTLPKDMERRGVLDDKVLPNYPYRDDGLLVYDAIKNYVTNIVNLYYDSLQTIKDDWELQNWAKELVKPKEEGGVGFDGVPGGGAFDNADDLIVVCTSIIFASSAQHAAANFSQYDEYGFPPNYPFLLGGKPPSDKSPVSEEDIMSCLPNKHGTLDIMSVTKILGRRGTTNFLGDWEIRYHYDPKALEVENEFRAELKKISQTIKERNDTRCELYKYQYLDPEVIPNSISM